MNKSLALLTTSSLLVACGGGGGGSDSSSPTPGPNVFTGTFIDSPVEGLYYETETRSGLTNELGEFEYLDGETVSFYIGGILLGQASADEILTPFSLAGIVPLTKEADITSKLTSDEFNSFDRALNISTLLQALDQDGNPENGINLGTAHKQLSSDSIDLYVKAVQFETQTSFINIRRKLDLRHKRTFIEAADHLYESLNIQIESSKVAEFVSEVNNQTIETVSYEYDENGNISLQQTDINNDGVVDFTKGFKYDENGNLSEITDSAANSVETISYDENNNIVSRLIDKPDSAQDLQENYVYLSNKLVRFERDKQANGAADTVTVYDYDISGNLTTYNIDKDGDGAMDSTAEYSYVDNRVVSFIEDKDNDGIPNFIIAYQYDSNGNRSSHNLDINSDGEADSFGAFTYDENNNITRYELDRDLDGNADYIEDYRYDNSGNRTQYRKDLDADGTWDSVAVYSYDINGNRTRMIEDSDGNGLVDKIWEGSYQAALLDNNWESITNQL